MGYLFTTKNGVPIQTNSFNLALKAANERLETPIRKNLTSHIFRHTLVSRLAENNVPLKAIMDRVGHADSKTTVQIYTHITKKMKSNVADIMENYWFYAPKMPQNTRKKLLLNAETLKQ